MGLYFFVLRGSLALLMLCYSVSGEKIRFPESKFDQRRLDHPLQSQAGEDARQTEEIIDQSPRHKMTRHSRRFSRPHALINPTKAPTVKQNAGKVLENEPAVVQQIATEIKATPDSVERPEPNQEAEEETTCMVGGNEDLTPVEVSLPSVPNQADAHRNDSHNSEHADDIPDKIHVNRTRRLKHKVRKSSSSVTTMLPRRLNYILSSLYTLRHHNNGTLCHSLCNITGITYVEYIRPYMTYLHQRASDAYDAQLEQQSVVKVKGKVNKEAHRKGPTNRKDKNWSMPKLSFRKKPSPVQRIASNGSVVATANNDTIQISSDINGQQVERRQALLKQNITFLSSIVASKDATVRELVQRLSILEQELSTLRQITSVTSAPAAAEAVTPLAASVVPHVESTAVESESSSSSSGDIHSVHQDSGELIEPHIVRATADEVPCIDVTAGTITNTTDAYELLQYVLNALYIVGTSTDTVANNILSESSETDAVLEFTDQPSMVETALVSVHPVVTDTAPIVYPSIVDSVIAERKVHEQYMQRLCDAAAVMAVVLPCCIETPTISVQAEDAAGSAQKEGKSGNTDTIPADTMPVNDYDTLNPLQSVVESLESQIAELNTELMNISAQLCHYRGQHFAPLDTMDDDTTGGTTSKHGWFW